MMNRLRHVPLPLLLLATNLFAADVYVTVGGNDANNGSKDAPLRTFAEAAKTLKPGDRLLITGHFTEPLILKGKRDIQVLPAQGAYPTLDGSDPLENLTWRPYKGDIYQAKLEEPIWQLFSDRDMVTAARWPNSHMWYRNFFNIKDTWRRVKGDGASPYGTITDAYPDPRGGQSVNAQNPETNLQSLAGTGVDMTGAIAIMNIGSWMTMPSRITRHKAGSNTFTYDTDWSEADDTVRRTGRSLAPGGRNERMLVRYWHPHYYMIEGLQCLDEGGEYWYDKDSGTLYLCPLPGHAKPGRYFRGKRRSYMLELHDCENVTVRDIDFFAATFAFNRCVKCTLENCRLKYPSMNRFQLGDLGMVDRGRITAPQGDKTPFPVNTIRNCRFSYFDGEAFTGCARMLVENCLMHNFQYTCMGGNAGAFSVGSGSVVRRCTVYRCGASEGIRGGARDTVFEYCRVYDHGGLQHDGSCFDICGNVNTRLIYRYNWVHDTPKIAYRFDSHSRLEKPNFHDLLHHTVSWNADNGAQVKGDDHAVLHNLCLSRRFELNTSKRWLSTNDRTLTANNIFVELNGPGVRKNNVIGQDVRHFLRDPDNYDFRPKPGSPLVGKAARITRKDLPEGFPADRFDAKLFASQRDIGPYQANAKRYWIPGYQDYAPSTPIPRHGAEDVPLDTNLMFLEAYRCTKHAVFLTDDRKALYDERPYVSPEPFNPFAMKQIAVLEDASTNIVTPPKLKPKTTYYWRVDPQDGRVHEPADSEIWTFTTR